MWTPRVTRCSCNSVSWELRGELSQPENERHLRRNRPRQICQHWPSKSVLLNNCQGKKSIRDSNGISELTLIQLIL